MKRLLFVLCAVLALTVGVSTASAGGGNSDAAKMCQKGGWQQLYTSTGATFTDQGACVSYAAKGGVLFTQTQHDCQQFGGTYSTNPSTDLVQFPTTLPFQWSCNGWVSTRANWPIFHSQLVDDCHAAAVGATGASKTPNRDFLSGNTSCYHTN